MSAIQLVFQNGIISPLIDGKGKGADEITTVQVSTSPIVAINSKSTGNLCAELTFVHKNGKKTVAFDKNYNSNSQEEVIAR